MAGHEKTLGDYLGIPTPLEVEELEKKRLGVSDTPLPDLETTAQDFAKGLLNTEQYRQSFLRRCVIDSLPPAVEIWLLNTAYGKPVERVEVANTTPVENQSVEALEDRYDRIGSMLELLRRQRRSEKDSESIH